MNTFESTFDQVYFVVSDKDFNLKFVFKDVLKQGFVKLLSLGFVMDTLDFFKEVIHVSFNGQVDHLTGIAVTLKLSLLHSKKCFVLKDSCFNYSDKWVDFYANIPDSTFTYEVRDSLSSAISRIYKHRFLWWRWGTKGYKQTIVNHNPRSKIVYNEIVKVEH